MHRCPLKKWKQTVLQFINYILPYYYTYCLPVQGKGLSLTVSKGTSLHVKHALITLWQTLKELPQLFKRAGANVDKVWSSIYLSALGEGLASWENLWELLYMWAYYLHPRQDIQSLVKLQAVILVKLPCVYSTACFTVDSPIGLSSQLRFRVWQILMMPLRKEMANRLLFHRSHNLLFVYYVRHS